MARIRPWIPVPVVLLCRCAEPLASSGAPPVLVARPAPDAAGGGQVAPAGRAEEPASAAKLFPMRPDPRVTADLATFRDRAGGASIAVDFDDLPPGSDLESAVIDGVSFRSGNARLLVVGADRTFVPEGYLNVPDPAAYRLPATSGSQILSPGGVVLAPGPDPALEDDDVTMIFDPPVAAVAFDLLLSSLDGMSFTDVTVLGTGGEVLYAGRIDIPRAHPASTTFPPPGAAFWGYVADACVIREVRIDETDGNADCPDANIGLDTIRLAPAPGWRAADLDEDGMVAASDLQVFAQQWIAWEGDPTAKDRWWRADANRDRRIDAEDLVILVSHLGR